MTHQTQNGQGLDGVHDLRVMEPFVKRLHANADLLHRIAQGEFEAFQHSRLKSMSFLINLLKEDALTLYGLHTQATKAEP